ncbi:uncharacterized protein [Nicotiana sylvestris]|uniref:uncharacterized protein n=1 Tax=Nicotiana sylvestris TaxID=4096 RepID=UPI00388C767C
MHTRFTSIINEIHSLGEMIPTNKLVRKILNVLLGSWEGKANAITKAKDLQKLTIDELIGNLKTYEMKRKNDLERKEPNEERNLVLKAAHTDSSSDESEMTEIPPKGEDDQGDASMMVVDNESSKYESIFALMAKSDDDEDKEGDEKNLVALNKRDDMVISIIDLKEQVEEVTRENNLLKNQTKNWMDNTKGKEVASKTQLELESELKKVKTSLVAELEKKRQLQKDLKRIKNDLDKSLKCTRSSDVITSMYKSNGGNKQGIRFQKAKTSYNLHKDEDGEITNAPDEAIDIANEKTDLMSQVKQSDKGDAAKSPKGTEELGPSITSTEAEHRVVDATLEKAQLERHIFGVMLDLMGYKETNCVAFSTADTEYMVVASCCSQLLQIKQHLKDFGVFTA